MVLNKKRYNRIHDYPASVLTYVHARGRHTAGAALVESHRRVDVRYSRNARCPQRMLFCLMRRAICIETGIRIDSSPATAKLASGHLTGRRIYERTQHATWG